MTKRGRHLRTITKEFKEWEPEQLNEQEVDLLIEEIKQRVLLYENLITPEEFIDSTLLTYKPTEQYGDAELLLTCDGEWKTI